MTGTFFAVVGPSGAGKDTLLRFAAATLGDTVHFPRRVITRTADPALEDHDVLTAAEFATAAAAGRFALTWYAHGLSYGIPESVDQVIADGTNVACNISRTAVAAARARFDRVAVVLITAPADVLTQRLTARGRDTVASINGRLARSDHVVPTGCKVHRIDNVGPIETAGANLVRLLTPDQPPSVPRFRIPPPFP